MIIGLDLDYAAADTVDQEYCPDQGLRHLRGGRMKIDG
jgi:hypothetical protein